MKLEVEPTGPPSTDMEAMVEHVEFLTLKMLRELHEQGSTEAPSTEG